MSRSSVEYAVRIRRDEEAGPISPSMGKRAQGTFAPGLFSDARADCALDPDIDSC